MKKQLLMICVAFFVVASEPAAETTATSWSGDFVTMGEFRNDTDFSEQGPVYDVDGQHGGFIGARFEPALVTSFTKDVHLKLRGELRLGGGNLPGEIGGDGPVSLFGKDLYVAFGDTHGFQGNAGLRERMGASGLVLSQPVIGFGAGWNFHDISLEVWAAQAEENSPEGLNFRDDNFAADHWIGSVDISGVFDENALEMALLGSKDSNPALEDRVLGIVDLSFLQEAEVYKAWAALTFGAGASEYGTIRTEEQSLLFWGVEFGFETTLSNVLVGINSMVLSGDDEHDGNGFNGSFQWSGKSKSRTIVFTEDESFRRNNSVSYALGNNKGPFKEMQSGLQVSELVLGYHFPSIDLAVNALAAIGSTLQSTYTGGRTDLGIETGLHAFWAPSKPLEVFARTAFVLPGDAAGWVLNETDVDGSEPMWVIQAGTVLSF